MRKALPALSFFSLIVLAIALIPHITDPVKRKYRPLAKYDGMGKVFEQEYLMTRNPRTGEVPRQKLLEAARFRDEKLLRMGLERSVAGLAWEERGPDNIGGRTRAILFDLNDQPNGYKKVWAGGVAGGLWYTNDITATSPVWQHVNDLFENMAISSIVQDPSDPDIMYFGTGEGWTNFDAVRGLGIWKTTNGGISWSQLSSTNNSSFYWTQKLAVLPNGTLLAATKSGIYQSTNNGTSFTKVLGTGIAGATINDAADIEIAANGYVYASLGINSSRDGIFRSDDNGDTWERIYTAAVNEARIDLACAPSDPEYVYAAVASNSGGIYRKTMRTTNATDATPTWNALTMPVWCDAGSNRADIARGQAWYDLIGMVDPADKNSFYLGTVDMFKTTDGGTNWSQITQWANGCSSGAYVHADIHAFVARPGNNQQVLVGCDGGIFMTTDGGASFSSRNYGYNITQYYSTAVHPTDANYFLAGSQDNGSQQYTTTGTNRTREVSGGDGALCFIDQDDPNIQITSYVYNNYYISTNGGVSFSGRSLNNSGNFINAADYDNTANILYSANTNGTYLRWDNVATGNPVPDTTWVTVTGFGTARPTYIGVSPQTANRVYFGLPNGTVLYVDGANAGSAHAGTTIKTANASPVSSIAIDPANENHMLVTHSSYGVTSVFETTDALSGTPTWTAVEGDLPDMPVRYAMFDPRNSDWALLATELGIWSTDNLNGASTEWNPTNTGLANVRVDMLKYSSATRTLAAATHGRGLYTTSVPNAGGGATINFFQTALQHQETPASLNGCRNYKDYTVSLTINTAPVGAATTTISVNGASTATRYLDFNISTTGDFSVPSNTLVFADAATESKTCYIRIYDDKVVETSESIVLDLAVSGTTNATAGSSNQFTFTINENDVLPTAGTSLVYNTGSPTAQGSNLGPFIGSATRGRFQYIVYAAELRADGLTAGPLNNLGMYVFTKASTGAFGDFTIRLGHTHSNAMNYGFLPNSLQTVFSADYTTSAGMNNFAFSSPFTWNGVDNILVEICYTNTAAIGDDAIYVEQYPAVPGDFPTAFVTAAAGQACSLNAAFLNTFRPSIEFTQTLGQTPLAGTLSLTATEYLGPMGEAYYYTSSGQLLAKLKNLGTHDYGCTQIIVDRAGTGSTAFWNNNTSDYLADKTIRILPASNDPAGNVEITVYFTEAEKQGWELATGQLWSNISLVKTNGAISAITPSNPGGPGDVEVVVPTRTTLGTHHALSYAFSTGFSGIGAGIPGAALPVTITSFTGAIKYGYSWLTWKTASEQHNKGFFIERSYNNQSFSTIGFVPGSMLSNNVLLYEFKDPQPARALNYYRLRQQDAGGAEQYSQTILLRSEPLNTNFSLIENPVKNRLGLNIGKNLSQPVHVRVVDLAGRVVEQWRFPQLSTQQLWLPLKQWGHGSYVVILESGNERHSFKMIR